MKQVKGFRVAPAEGGPEQHSGELMHANGQKNAAHSIRGVQYSRSRDGIACFYIAIKVLLQC